MFLLFLWLVLEKGVKIYTHYMSPKLFVGFCSSVNHLAFGVKGCASVSDGVSVFLFFFGLADL